ncbi:MAG: hypothetical protein NTW52_19805 [Planctomycetota bacterium]|nr:hypothetical protein [Planctomycetota bacterium]
MNAYQLAYLDHHRNQYSSIFDGLLLGQGRSERQLGFYALTSQLLCKQATSGSESLVKTARLLAAETKLT